MLEDHWAQLPAPSATGGISSTHLSLELGSGAVRVGVDARGHRHLLVPLAADAPEVSDRSTKGVVLSTRALESDEGSRRFVDLECARPDLSGVFTGLAADICLGLLSDSADPGPAVALHFEDWKALLGADHERWTRPRLAGLVAELLVLDQLLDRDRRAVSWWSGPLGEAQDFRSARHAIEVKASVTREGRLVRIHGTDQLEPPVGGSLGLVWFRLAPAGQGHGVGLVELIRRCGERGGAAAVIDRLDRLGLPALSEPEIAEARFEVVERRWYSVDDHFPAINPGRFVAGTVPAGVGAVEYLVDLDVVRAEDRPLNDFLSSFVELS